MARKKSDIVGRVFGRLSISHVYVLGVLALTIAFGYPLVRNAGKVEVEKTPGLAFDVRVTVLNGCGSEGVAESVASSLREVGFDIVGTGNADAFDYERTLVVDRCGSPDKARRVGDALKCRCTLTQRVIGPESDVVVVVGSDWPDLRL